MLISMLILEKYYTPTERRPLPKAEAKANHE